MADKNTTLATFSGNAPNATARVEGTDVTLPYTQVFTPGQQVTVDVLSPQTPSPDIQYVFGSWSDGQPQQHLLSVPSGGTP